MELLAVRDDAFGGASLFYGRLHLQNRHLRTSPFVDVSHCNTLRDDGGT
jgi:hypothetical protein